MLRSVAFIDDFAQLLYLLHFVYYRVAELVVDLFVEYLFDCWKDLFVPFGHFLFVRF